MFTDGGLDKNDVVQIYNGMLLNHKKEQTLAMTAWLDVDYYAK